MDFRTVVAGLLLIIAANTCFDEEDELDEVKEELVKIRQLLEAEAAARGQAPLPQDQEPQPSETHPDPAQSSEHEAPLFDWLLRPTHLDRTPGAR